MENSIHSKRKGTTGQIIGTQINIHLRFVKDYSNSQDKYLLDDQFPHKDRPHPDVGIFPLNFYMEQILEDYSVFWKGPHATWDV